MPRIALIADYSQASDNHRATEAAIDHSAKKLGLPIDFEWISTKDLIPSNLSAYQGVWLTTGTYENWPVVLNGIQFARQNKIPTLGTCSGFQHLVLELARNVVGISEASHEEYDPSSPTNVISRLPCSLRGREMSISIQEGSVAHNLYRESLVNERYYCNFGVSVEFVERFRDPSIRISGSDDEGIMRIFELVDHPFYMGTLFVPQARSTWESTHPLIDGYVRAVAG